MERWSERAEEDRHGVRGGELIMSGHGGEVFDGCHVMICLSAIWRSNAILTSCSIVCSIIFRPITPLAGARFISCPYILVIKIPRIPSSEMAVMEHANPKQSRLESLPTELLEQIFLQCLNLNLPLASSHLSTALSSTRTKMAVVLKVFPSNASFNLEHYTELSQTVWAGGASDTEMGIGELQSRILACRWMTWEFLKLCMETFVVRTLIREFRAQNLPWQEGMPVEEQPYDAPRLPWHGGAPVKESVVRDFVHEVFALKVHLGIRYEWELDDCELTEDEQKIRKKSFQKLWEQRANGEATGEDEEEEFDDSDSEDFDDDENFDRGYQCLGVETWEWDNNANEGKTIGDVIITPSLRTFSWSPGALDGTPKISIGIGPRNGLVILGTRLECEKDSTMFEVNSRRWRCLFCRFDTKIPVKLLHGPWTEDQLSFLQALIEAGADLDRKNETHRQIAKQGLTEAINEDDYRAVDLLISEDMESQYSQRYEDNYFEPSFGEAEFVMDVCDGSRDWVRTPTPRRTVNIKPDTEQLKLAVIEHGCRRKIVKRILWAAYSDIDRTDPAVVEWAEKKEEGDRNGQWLLDQLTKSGDRNRMNLERMERSSSYDFSIFACGSNDGTGSDAQSGDGDETGSQDDSGSSRTSSSEADIPPYETE